MRLSRWCADVVARLRARVGDDEPVHEWFLATMLHQVGALPVRHVAGVPNEPSIGARGSPVARRPSSSEPIGPVSSLRVGSSDLP